MQIVQSMPRSLPGSDLTPGTKHRNSLKAKTQPEWRLSSTNEAPKSPNGVLRSISPSSATSLESTGGDSGVSSDRGTPPLTSRRSHLYSYSDDSTSAESPPPMPSPSCKSCRVVGAQPKLPTSLLREIKIKSREILHKRHGDFRPQNDYIQNGHKNERPKSLCSGMSTLSLASSFCSMSSLTENELDCFSVTRNNSRALYECRDATAAEHFGGVNPILGPRQEATLKSARGTVRGVKNRVRAGIDTFTTDHAFIKMFADRERGKVIIYVTTLGVVRETFERCLRLRKILWTLSIPFEQRDVFMSRQTQIQLRDRLPSNIISVPHVFLEGQHLGGVEFIEKLNENGDLRRILNSYMRPARTRRCELCGDFRVVPCVSCRGSKKSVHRNHFRLEFVALKCVACDEAGLVACQLCCGGPETA